MKHIDLFFEGQARRALIDGAGIFTRAVGCTLGPRGRTVVIRKRGVNTVTKDGVTVAREVHDLADERLAIGSKMMRKASETAVDEAGDGTTTVAVLTYALVQEGHRLMAAGFNARDLVRGMESAAAALVRSLTEMSRPCEGRDALYRVALVAANGDTEVANIVTDALLVGGRHGIVTIEDGYGTHCRLRHVKGMQFSSGWLSPEFITNQGQQAAVYDNPLIMVCACHLFRMDPLAIIMGAVHASGRPLLVIAQSVTGQVMKTFAINAKRGTLKVVAVEAPFFKDIQQEALRDIAAVTGAVIHDPYTGRRLEDMKLEHLGTAKRITVDKRSTTIIGGAGRDADVQARAQAIMAARDREPNPHERERFSERLSKLVGGAGVISVGGVTETATKERRDRFDDALHAGRAAMESGVLPGGGIALLRAALGLCWLKGDHTEGEAAGIKLMAKACEAPLRQIVANAGGRPDWVVQVLRDREPGYCDAFGWNAATSTFEPDMVGAGIVDPTKVTMTAVEKAVATAGLILNTGCIIQHKE